MKTSYKTLLFLTLIAAIAHIQADDATDMDIDTPMDAFIDAPDTANTIPAEKMIAIDKARMKCLEDKMKLIQFRKAQILLHEEAFEAKSKGNMAAYQRHIDRYNTEHDKHAQEMRDLTAVIQAERAEEKRILMEQQQAQKNKDSTPSSDNSAPTDVVPSNQPIL